MRETMAGPGGLDAATAGAFGIIAGSDLAAAPPFDAAEQIVVDTRWGLVPVRRLAGGSSLILRHGPQGRVPPHAIPHRAHIEAFRTLGVDAICAFCSTGSLRSDLAPGRLVVVDDWIEGAAPPSFHDHDAEYVTPELDAGLRRHILDTLARLALPAVDGGVYWQTRGPRLETRAEVRMLAQFADVVGMTFGHEATLANEAGLPIAAICSIDNYAHGLAGAERLRAEEILAHKASSAGRMAEIARALIAR